MTWIPYIPDWVTGVAAGFAGLLVLQLLVRQLRKDSAKGKTVFITGGSEGIGKEMARDLVQRGAHVVIMARRVEVLQKAAEEIDKSACFGGTVAWATIDVLSVDGVGSAIDAAVEKHGPPDILITAAGAAHPGYFLEQSVDTFSKAMDLNYMGTLRVVKKVAPLMVAKGGGRIMMLSSAAGVVSIIGYSSYSPTKYALRGLADALRTELSGFGIKVSICYPPDTDTPGFARENESKPPETLACFPVSPYKADDVARQSISSMLKNDYHIQSVDFLQNLLVSHASAITPRSFFLLETLLQPVLCLAAVPFWMWFDYQSGLYAKRELSKAKSD